MTNPCIDFAEDFGGKIYNSVFTTIRKGEYEKHLNKTFDVCLEGSLFCRATLISIKHEDNVEDISDELLMLDTGCLNTESATEILREYLDNMFNPKILVFKNGGLVHDQETIQEVEHK